MIGGRPSRAELEARPVGRYVAPVAAPIRATPAVSVQGDGPGSYGAVCDDCTGTPDFRRPCGETRYYKRDAKADLAFHVAAHEAWARGEKHRDWPRA